jgi:hypothetical protein
MNLAYPERFRDINTFRKSDQLSGNPFNSCSFQYPGSESGALAVAGKDDVQVAHYFTLSPV